MITLKKLSAAEIEELRAQRLNALLRRCDDTLPPFRCDGYDIVALRETWSKSAPHLLEFVNALPRRPRVSDFSNWVLRHYNLGTIQSSLRKGIEGETSVERHREFLHKLDLGFPASSESSWKLIHNGIAHKESKPFRISRLKLDGNALTAVPDLVFQEMRTGKIAIVEIKVSHKPVWANGWPNLRAQLWAYSHIDDWADAPEIILAGEVWSPPILPIFSPTWKITHRWNSRDESLNNECELLFRTYGGSIAA